MAGQKIEFYIKILQKFLNVTVGFVSCSNITDDTVWIGRDNTACWGEICEGCDILLEESVDWNVPFLVGDLESVVEGLCNLWRVTEAIEWQEDSFSVLGGKLLYFADTRLDARCGDWEMDLEVMDDGFGLE